MADTVYGDVDHVDHTILREQLADYRSVMHAVTRHGEKSCESFGDVKAQGLAIEGRNLVEQAKNAAAISVASDKNSAALGVQADRNASALSVQADRNTAESRLQLETKYNLIQVQAQTFASAAALQAQTIDSATKAAIAACCCQQTVNVRDAKDAILADGQKTRDLINENTRDQLRDENLALRNQINALFARNVPPGSPSTTV